MTRRQGQRFIRGVIYRARRGPVYDDSRPRYNCYIPEHTGDFWCCDCWVTDQRGNIHPGYNASPVPVALDKLGKPTGRTLKALPERSKALWV